MKDEDRYLVTGATGCIGSWVVRNLIRQGVPTAVLDHSGNHRRLELILDEEELTWVTFYRGDITDFSAVNYAILSFNATNIIHLAGLQLPFCRANPPLGASVNVVGTLNIFEAGKQAGIKKITYASSMAVYGPMEEYAQYQGKPLPHDAPLIPRSHYGVFKQANELNARLYWQESNISSIGIRPFVVYGPGRDQGVTSTPTKAMIAAVLDQPYTISFDGRIGFEFADDTAKAFIRASQADFEGAEAFNIGISFVNVPDIIGAIEAVEPAAKGKIRHDSFRLPLPIELDNSALVSVIGEIPETPLDEGIRQTIETYRRGLQEGRFTPSDLQALIQ